MMSDPRRHLPLPYVAAALLLSALSTVVIMCIIVSCVGFVTLAFEQSFGFMEAICVTICVGFSIDFVAHLAIAYMESPGDTRYARTRKALADLGVSIAGASPLPSGSPGARARPRRAR